MPLRTSQYGCMQGGVGTVIPMFMRFLEYIRVAQRNLAAQYQQQEVQHQYPSSPGAPPGPAPVAAAPQQFVQTALVDPNDPSKVCLGPAYTLTWLPASTCTCASKTYSQAALVVCAGRSSPCGAYPLCAIFSAILAGGLGPTTQG